jgi:hypothetical protein
VTKPEKHATPPEPPGQKGGGESIAESHDGPPDPRDVPRRDSHGPEAPGEAGRGIPEKKGGKR